jgi:ABC-2 type transport system ATP-binding protein
MSGAQDNAVVQARSLRYSWGTSPALENVSFALAPGQITGFLGRNGAGKSTTLRILAGILVPDAGVALIDRQPAHHPRARAQVGFAPEEPALAAGLTVREQLSFAARLRGLERAKGAAQIEELLVSLDLTSVSERLCRALSRGTRQRVGVAMAMLGQPRVLLLDEPTAGLDPAQVARLHQLLVDQKASGTAIFLSSHVTSELESLVDEVVVVARGRTVHASSRTDFAAAVSAVAADGVAPQMPAAGRDAP